MSELIIRPPEDATTDLLIRGGRVLDPARTLDSVMDLLLRDGFVAAMGPGLDVSGVEEFDARGLVVCPAFVDLHTHLREPGQEYKETVATGTRAAARGGFGTVCAMPNTDPVIDTPAVVRLVQRQGEWEGSARVLVIGAVTKGRAGKELAEMAAMVEVGVFAFSDDGACVSDPVLMRAALEYAAPLRAAIIQHAEDPVLVRGGVMHEGWVSTRLGLRGQPAAAEEAIVARDIALAAATGGYLHIAHLSTAGAVELVRGAKARGLNVTAEVTPHHLTLSHEAVMRGPAGTEVAAYDTNARVNPPLRTPADVEACIEGLRDGTIDAVATDHAPHATTEKAVEFDDAAPGLVGLETALPLVLRLVRAGRIPLIDALARMTIGPVRALRLNEGAEPPELGTLVPGAPADVTVFDPEARWTVEPRAFASKGKNTPFDGWEMQGKVVLTVMGGRITHREDRAGQ